MIYLYINISELACSFGVKLTSWVRPDREILPQLTFILILVNAQLHDTVMVVVSQKLDKKCIVPGESWTRDLCCVNPLRYPLAHTCSSPEFALTLVFCRYPDEYLDVLMLMYLSVDLSAPVLRLWCADEYLDVLMLMYLSIDLSAPVLRLWCADEYLDVLMLMYLSIDLSAPVLRLWCADEYLDVLMLMYLSVDLSAPVLRLWCAVGTARMAQF